MVCVCVHVCSMCMCAHVQTIKRVEEVIFGSQFSSPTLSQDPTQV